MKMKNIANNLLILGSGGHGKVVADIAITTGKWDNIAFLDDNNEIKEVIGVPVVGTFKDIVFLKNEFSNAFVALGNNAIRLQWIDELLRLGFIVPTIIHPFSCISSKSNIGAGTVIMPGTAINAGSCTGMGCIINTSSSIDHDCVLADGVHISPGVHLGGTVKVDMYTWICIGSSVANNITIGRNVIIGAGTVVTKNVPDYVMAAGVPAIIKKQLYKK